ncbi:Lipid A biosynthesis lauroyl acyltransferase [Nitrincola lacisaponensis]|uniref:Lipid A biosynthesis lauroyl acyltransferase n=1 Tax=Nitrincola lacisaponensis TaxID=267850 RepID=A0A063YAS5_9GAMM|nr:lysophospholipid acyltransferase family protein [Nitrincola lacisaponensis]KDE41397.1 Lipid A biosynthesis lauroyl acyltransferase [Nitrincola lacisaponensis]
MKSIKGVLALLALGLMALLPLRWAQALGKRIGRRMYRQGDANRMCRYTRANLQACLPELSQAEREQLVAESLEQTGQSIAEMGMSWLWPVRWSLNTIRAVHHESLITEGIAAGKGVILIAPHLGNWEVLNLYLSNRYPFTAMYKPPRQKQLDNLIRRMRARLGTDMAPANVQGVRKVMKALKRSEMVGILPDQEPEADSGIYADFFGIPALTMKLLPQLAAQTGARVICGYARRLPDAAGFEIFFSEADAEITSRDLQLASTAMNRSVERCVRELPAQYQWEYKRFNSRPEGEKSIY